MYKNSALKSKCSNRVVPILGVLPIREFSRGGNGKTGIVANRARYNQWLAGELACVDPIEEHVFKTMKELDERQTAALQQLSAEANKYFGR